MRTISITSSNIVNNKNAHLRYNFPSGSVFKNKQIGLASLSMFFSYHTISQKKNNNKFQYIWDGTTYDVTIPDLIASIETINNAFQFTMRTNNHYEVNADGDSVYFMEFIADATRNSVTIITKKVPTSSTTTNPSGSNSHFTYPSSEFMPVVKMISSNNFHKIIGYENTFQSSSTLANTQTVNSSTSPIVNPDSQLIVEITNGIINNEYANPQGIIHSFFIFSSIGSLIETKPNEVAFVDIQDGEHTFIDIQIKNAATLELLDLLDPEVNILLLIKDK